MVNIEKINNFLSDKEKCPKIMVGTEIFKTYTTMNDDEKKYNEFIRAKNDFNLNNDCPYFNCRIFSIENVSLAINIIKHSDGSFIFLNRKKVYNKYSIIEAEIFISYSNPNFKEIMKKLSMIEFINGIENNFNTLFEEIEKYYNYINMQSLNVV